MRLKGSAKMDIAKKSVVNFIHHALFCYVWDRLLVVLDGAGLLHLLTHH